MRFSYKPSGISRNSGTLQKLRSILAVEKSNM